MTAELWGDYDPEDAYDAGDPVARRLDVVRRWVGSLVAEVTAGDPRGRAAGRIAEALRVARVLQRAALDPDQAAALADDVDQLLTLDDMLGGG